MLEGLRVVLLLLTAAVVTVALAKAARLPSMLAYLAIGVAVGPHALNWLHESEQTERLAEFGVVFLMFSIGLEFSLPRLVSMRWQVFGLGGAQVAATMLATLLIGLTGGIPWQGGLALGAIYAMSSTAIVGRLLAEKLDLHSASGRRTMSVLLFQDLMVVFMLILIPALVDTTHLVEAMGKNHLLRVAKQDRPPTGTEFAQDHKRLRGTGPQGAASARRNKAVGLRCIGCESGVAVTGLADGPS